jgi:hypothetical protein
MDDGKRYADFEEQVKAADRGGCSDALFRQLGAVAVMIYKTSPRLGERTAELMSGLWARNHSQWADKVADELGQLFADLDIPPDHVAGGEAGARRKWQQIDALISKRPATDSPAG